MNLNSDRVTPTLIPINVFITCTATWLLLINLFSFYFCSQHRLTLWISTGGSILQYLEKLGCLWNKFHYSLRNGAKGAETASWSWGPCQQPPATICGDIKSEPLSSDPFRGSEDFWSRENSSKQTSEQSSFLTMSLMEIKNVLALAGVSMWPWETTGKQYLNICGSQQEAPDKGFAEKTEIWKTQGFLSLEEKRWGAC